MVPWCARIILAVPLVTLSAYQVARAVDPNPGAADLAPNERGLDVFERSIRPVLIEHCYECHSASADSPEAGLRVDHRDGLLEGGDSGPAIVAGDPKGSLLLRALEYDEFQMPPGQKLPEDVIKQFATWIKLGAPDPRDETPVLAPASTPMAEVAQSIDWDEAQTFWAFQTPVAPPLPPVLRSTWPKRRHDYFVLSRMEQAGLEPAEPASTRAWRRRVGLDLIGLPPDGPVLALEDAVSDPFAEVRFVDHLMATPQFGERWARLWLDLARYAEDQAHIVGNDKELFYPNAYMYRDWVINAFNQDIPYDDFVRMQLAADRLNSESHDDVALGFLGLGPKYYDRERLEVQAEEWEDRVDTVCRSLLGLTVACARCHDHKYDPIPTADYYSLASVFASTRMVNRPFDGAEVTKDGQAKNPEQSMHIVGEGEVRDLAVFIRGNVNAKGTATQRGFLTVLSLGEQKRFHSGSGRMELAEVIVDARNPLTARVLVNRIWDALIGYPIVATPSNFGSLGQRPSHPLLLDDLSVRLIRNDWSIKWLVREIVTSATYRQSSFASSEQQRSDPANVWLSRMHRKRLDVEALRDSLLFVAHRLNSTIGGPSIQPDDTDSTRRTIYATVSRFQLNSMLSTFDFPDANIHAARRVNTTTPLQKLFVMNHPFVTHQAEATVDDLRKDIQAECESGIVDLYHRIFGRNPTTEERRLGIAFVGPGNDDRRAAWVQYAQALMASNEFLFVD